MAKRRGREVGLIDKVQRDKTILAVAVVIALVATAATFVYIDHRSDQTVTAEVSRPARTVAPSPEPVLAPVVPLNSILAKLQKGDRPFNIAVFGDSTGISSKGWQVLVPDWIGKTYDRPTYIKPWGKNTDEYEATWTLRNGSRAPITVYNGSIPGQNVTYISQRVDRILPLTSADLDLVFVSFGHTEPINQAKGHVANFMNALQSDYPNATVVNIEQNPDWSPSFTADIQQQNVRHIANWAVTRGFPSMPVNKAFVDYGQFNRLLDEPTRIHPNADGYRLWAQVVIEELITAGLPRNVPVPGPVT
ncbi:hypothetical protein CH278_06040 [Rhodococcus sp. 05-2254-5]|uniref:SGNH/GDSL hydrolase family protein n=1 Tax=unclassified Rhodococcus (in: high G+C Gram-positive bacteria) TaxID=192944 RepID=UPI000B9A7C3A|nr:MULTISPECIES: SGNH/GDSL hydrolase family protein [unclassified Rhodococcus (in: high G+C Gram-positive bacteria)]OZE36968.1 hypothetical protein CH278_06040 [Rhodococcus sp. 05-2254-5]OZE54718.1 hypothetical protein CH269_16825 [Rhodococcus sp. 05-2254-1]